MTRRDLADKNIERLESIEEAIELINILDYDECLAVLNGTKNLPSEMFSALIDRAKSLRGTTLALMMASLQNVINK